MFSLLTSVKRRMSSREHAATNELAPACARGGGLQSRAIKAVRGNENPPPLLQDSGGGGSLGSSRGLYKRLQSPAEFEQLGPLKDASGLEAWKLFRAKLGLCGAVVFDFTYCARQNATAPNATIEYCLFAKEIEAKRQTLQEILQFLTDNHRTAGSNIDAVADEIVQMVASNIFRPLPPPARPTTPIQSMIEDELDCTLDPVYLAGWIHLQVVYEIFLALVVCPSLSPKVTKRLVDQSFVLKLLELFASEDGREREYLKTVTHRLYGKIMGLRSFIRKSIEHIFLCYIEDHYVQCGVSELLEILGSIINGFAQPLKEEHISFLNRCMIPLHKSKNLIMFHQQLSYCMVQYVEKEARLLAPIVGGILRYWPVCNTPKEVLLINELEDLLDVATSGSSAEAVLLPLFRRLAQCIESPHFQISERTLFLWNNPKIIKLVNQHKYVLYPVVIAALYRNTQNHWNFTVHSLSFNVSKLLAEADPRLYAQCTEELKTSSPTPPLANWDHFR